jgi:UDP-glucose 4-epimerase
LCHHGAEVGDYRNPEFDISGAIARNTWNMRDVLRLMGERNLKGVVLTGSIFEHGEGAGDQPLRAFSPYAVSKGLTAQIVCYNCSEFGIRFGKFVIPNPFGPLEQPRLGAYLARTWAAGEIAEIKTPDYIRDNIHVSLLAACYRRFVEETESAPPARKLNPSGYVESQGAFVERVAREVGRRTGMSCAVRLLPQTRFAEPVIRVNTDSARRYVPGWSESAAWDEYSHRFRRQ